mmetsp:Transcript_55834/g.62423  ORF Transcript_55834/g.62423 Transcript_55834/m.62423 type:complete len:967 (+) Transcript_55834:260-3160(+)
MFRPVSTTLHAQQHTLLVISSSSASSSSSLKAIIVLMVSLLLLSSSSSVFFSSTTTRIITSIRPCQSFSFPFAVAFMSTTTSTTASRSRSTNSNSKLKAFQPKLRSRSGNNSKSRNNDRSNFHTHYRVTTSSVGGFINSNTDTTNSNVEEPTPTTTPTTSNASTSNAPTTATNISNSNSNKNDNTNTNTNQHKMKVEELKPTISTPTPTTTTTTTISNAADTDANTDASTDTDISNTTPTRSNQVEEMGNSQNRNTDQDQDNRNSNSNTNENKKFRLSNRILHTLDPCVVKTKGWIQQYSHLWEEGKDSKNHHNRIDDHHGIFSLAQGVVYWKPPPACHSALRDAVRSTTTMLLNEEEDDDDNSNVKLNVNVKEIISAADADSNAAVKGGDSTTITTTITTMMQRIVSRFLRLSDRVRQTSVGRAIIRLVMHGKRLLLLGRNERPILRETETRTTPPLTVTTVTAPTAPTNTTETPRSDDDKDEEEEGDNNKKNESDLFSLHAYGPERGIPELVTALKDKIRIEHNMIEHDVTVTVGANQAYTNVVLTIMGDDNNVNNDNTHVKNNVNNKAVVFAPYYFNHVMALQMCCGPKAVVVGPTDMTTGIPDLDWLTKQLQDNASNNDNYHNNNNIRMVTVVNPGNPTGIALEYDYVQKMVDLCQHYGVWLVLDCTYEHFFNYKNDNDDNTNNNRNKKSSGSVLPTFPNDPHVIHLFSFSKGYSLAGYRCGYVVTHQHNPNSGNTGSGSEDNDSGSGSNSGGSDFLRQMLKVQDTIPIGPPRISQHVAVGALKQGMKENNNDDINDDGTTGSSSSSTSSSLYYSAASRDWVTAKYATLDQSRYSILKALSSLPQTLGGSGSMYVMGKLPENLILPSSTTSKTNDNDNNNTGNNNEHDSNSNSNSNDTDVEPIDVHFCRVLIRDYGIAIIPGSFCGLAGWVRICYANLSPTQTLVASQRLQKGIQELTGVVK